MEIIIPTNTPVKVAIEQIQFALEIPKLKKQSPELTLAKRKKKGKNEERRGRPRRKIIIFGD